MKAFILLPALAAAAITFAACANSNSTTGKAEKPAINCNISIHTLANTDNISSREYLRNDTTVRNILSDNGYNNKNIFQVSDTAEVMNRIRPTLAGLSDDGISSYWEVLPDSTAMLFLYYTEPAIKEAVTINSITPIPGETVPTVIHSCIQAKEKLEELTARNIGRRIVIIVNDEYKIAPFVNDIIETGDIAVNIEPEYIAKLKSDTIAE